MEIGILGPLEVRADGQAVEIRGARLRALLVRLALDAGRTLSAPSLASALWDGEDVADEANALQSLVSRLRRALPDPSVLVSTASGYRLALEPACVDATVFARQAREGRDLLQAEQPAAAAEVLRRALALWRGPALDDVTTAPFAATEQSRLEELHLTAREDLLAADIALGRHDEAVAELEVLCATYPLRERLVALRMSALYAAGRQAEALAAYEQARHVLADELGVDPGEDLRAAHLAVLRGEPTPRTAPPVSHRTGSQLTSFVGREEAVTALSKQLEEHRLVTLVGPGGAGKTRLANETAERVAARFPGGIQVATLAPLDEPSDLAQSVANGLGLRERTISGGTGPVTPRDALTRLVDGLTGPPTLLVLDNCEHLVEAAAELADDLLLRCPHLHILATSREPLGIVGEVLSPVQPLDRPEPGTDAAAAMTMSAVRLFADRAAAVQPGFVVDASNVEAVIEVCRRLDGLPLAIELAAARLRTMGVAQIAARLDDRFRLLTGGSRTALPRHRTLRGVVSWSWDLLDDAERSLAEQVAVFPGGVTPESAHAVAASGSPAKVLDVLSALVDKSLLHVQDPDEPRYRMLETIREFGIDQLAERGALAGARQAHATYFRTLAAEADHYVRTREQLPWIKLLVAERDNCSAALRFSVDTGDAGTAYGLCAGLCGFWTMMGSHDEALDWTTLVRGLPHEDVDPIDLAVVLAIQALSAGVLEQPARAQRAEVLALLPPPGETAAHPLLSLVRPILAFIDGEAAEDALETINEGMETADPWGHATLLLFRAMLRQNRGDLASMSADIDEASAMYGAIGDRWGRAMTLMTRGETLGFSDEVDAARASYLEAEELVDELGAYEDQIQVGFRLAALEASTGRLAEARARVTKMAELIDRAKLPRLQMYLRIAEANCATAAGEDGLAKTLFEDALAEMSDHSQGNMQLRSGALTALGHLEARDGRLPEAHALHVAAYRVGIDSHDMPCAALAAVGLADVELRSGRPLEAVRILALATALRGIEDRGPGETRRVSTAARQALGDDEYEAAYAAVASIGHDAARTALDNALLNPP